MRRLEFLQNFDRDLAGGTKLMASTPQTVAHALADSPAGQLAWSAQFLGGCSDDFVLTNAAIYWLTNTSASANRLYYENAHAKPPPSRPRSPSACPASPRTSKRCGRWPSATTTTSSPGTVPAGQPLGHP